MSKIRNLPGPALVASAFRPLFHSRGLVWSSCAVVWVALHFDLLHISIVFAWQTAPYVVEATASASRETLPFPLRYGQSNLPQ